MSTHDNSIKKVALIGPECTGKSDLAAYLANFFHTKWVREYAREYLQQIQRPYVETDLLQIAKGQQQRELKLLTMANNVLICDTNVLVVEIWSNVKYGKCHPEIKTMSHQMIYDMHLLTFPDIPWEEDSQRESPHAREDLWQEYQHTLRKRGVQYVDIRGSQSKRRKKARDAIKHLISTHKKSLKPLMCLPKKPTISYKTKYTSRGYPQKRP